MFHRQRSTTCKSLIWIVLAGIVLFRYPLVADTVAHWTFDEQAGDTLHDISANGNYGIIFGAAWTGGYVGGALSFDGVDDYVLVPDDITLNTALFTVEVIIKPVSSHGGRIISKDNGSSIRNWFLAFYGDYGNIGHFGVFSQGTHNHYAVTTTSALTINEWTHLAAVYDGNISKIYINGVLEDTLIVPETVDANGGEAINIGRYRLSSNYFHGLIDAIRISNTALSPGQFLPFPPALPGLVGYYPFNGNANDESGNGNHGTIHGGVECNASDRFGNANCAAAFNGSDGYISTGISMDNYPQLSLSVWMKSGSAGIHDAMIFARDDVYGIGLMLNNPASQVRFDCYTDSGSAVAFDTTSNYIDNQWHHIVGVYDGQNISLFIDNELMDIDQLSGITNVLDELKIGWDDCPTCSPPQFWTGELDDILIYSRALTALEVDSLYHVSGSDAYEEHTTFTDDFTVFDTTQWTQYDAGSNNVNVDEQVPDAVYVDAARNWEPACRITHEMHTGADDFYAQFDIKWTGGQQGGFEVGWSTTNEYSYVQSHSDYSTLEDWDNFVALHFGDNRSLLLSDIDGVALPGTGIIYDGMNQGTTYTAVFERINSLVRGQIWTVGKDSLLGELTTTTSRIDDYRYFHISTWDNMMNGVHSYYTIDNLTLHVGTPIPETGLVVYYPFNGNANDISGNGYHGTTYGAALVPDRFDTANSAYYFDGIDDYIDLVAGIINGLSQISYFAWIKLQSIGGGGSALSASLNPTPYDCQELLHFRYDSVFVAQIGLENGYESLIYDLPNDVFNEWAFVGAIYNGTTYSSYYNGVKVDSAVIPYGSVTEEGMVTIGKRVGSGYQFHGAIDDLVIFNRALTLDEVDSLFHIGGWQIPETGLVAYYPFNGNANDESGNGNHGTVSGATLVTDRCGNSNNAYFFNGSSDFITMGNIPNAPDSNYSINCWVNTSDHEGALVRKRVIAGTGFYMGIGTGPTTSNGRMNNEIQDNIGTRQIHETLDLINDNHWHMVTGVKNDTLISLYIDGELAPSSVYYSTGTLLGSLTNNADLIIGTSQGGGNWYEGIIDDISIYDIPLSADAIDAFYRENMITATVGSISSHNGDTIRIPISVVFPSDSIYDSAELRLGNYQSGLDYMGVDTVGTLIGGKNWAWAENETDTLLLTAYAGSEDISGSGVFCYLRFIVNGVACSDVPLDLLYAKFNSNSFTDIENGIVHIEPTPVYGDVDSNGAVEAHDAALILKHLVGVDTLVCQELANAEVSANDTLTALDASIILQFCVGLVDTLPYTTPLLAAGILDLEDGILEMGQPLEIPLYLTGGNNILSCEGQISYDPERLTFESVTWSGLLNGFMTEVVEEPGTITFAAAGSHPDGAGGTFATVRFQVNQEDSTMVSLDWIRWNEEPVEWNVASGIFAPQVSTGEELQLPERFSLHQNFPNPFNPTTTLRYDLPEVSHVKLKIYDLLGREVTTLVNRTETPGYKAVLWDGRDHHGKFVGAGVYLYQIRAGDYLQTRKMILLK